MNCNTLDCDVFYDATVLPTLFGIGGVYCCQRPLKQAVFWGSSVAARIQAPYIESTQKITKGIYCGPLINQFGHFILEGISRLWYAKNNPNLPILWTSGTKCLKMHKEILELLSIHNDVHFINQSTFVNELHLPSIGYYIYKYFDTEYLNFISCYESQKIIKGKKVYISRTKVTGGGYTNENDIEYFLKNNGWEIFYPEMHSIKFQLETMSSAEIILAIESSALHSIIFQSDIKTKIFALDRFGAPDYQLIPSVKKLKYITLKIDKRVIGNIDNPESYYTRYELNIDSFMKIMKDSKFLENDDRLSNIIAIKDYKCIQNIVPSTPSVDLKCGPSLSSYYKGVLCYNEKKYLEAEAFLLQSIDDVNLFEKMHSFDGIPYILLCRIYNIFNNTDQAIYYVKKAISCRPDPTGFRDELVALLIKKNQFTPARQVIDSVLDFNPKTAWAYYRLCQIDLKLNNSESALKNINIAVSLHRGNPQYCNLLIDILKMNGNEETAITLCNDSILLDTTQSWPYYQLCLMFKNKNNICSIHYIEKAISLEPDSTYYKSVMVGILRDCGEIERAINICNDAISNNKNNGWAFYHLSCIAKSKNKISKSIQYILMAIECDPYAIHYDSVLTHYLMKTEKYEEFLKIGYEILTLNPNSSYAYYYLSRVKTCMHEYNEAITLLTNALSATFQAPALWREQLKNLLAKKASITPNSFSPVVIRINSIATYLNAKSYLEIGVDRGTTFNAINIPHKTGVDPSFKFDIKEYKNSTTLFYEETSDSFFEKLKQDSQKKLYGSKDTVFCFDVIFIDGLHTYEQALRDFENSITYSHDKTIWIFDDTCPSQCFSALNSGAKAVDWRAFAGLKKDNSWHGDVFKVIFAIHDKYPQFSYCTQTNKGNPQTILWRTETPTNRNKAFSVFESIVSMRYEDFVENAWILYPVDDEDVIDKIYTNIDPEQYKTGNEFKRVIKRIMTDNERQYAQEIIELKNRIKILEKEIPVTTV